MTDFNTHNKFLTGKLLHQSYRYHKLRNTFSKFYRRHYVLVSKFKVAFKSLLQQGLSESEFYGDLVYNLRETASRAYFSDQFRKKLSCITNALDININVMRQSACLVSSPITVDSFASVFNCTPVGRASDSMKDPT